MKKFGVFLVIVSSCFVTGILPVFGYFSETFSDTSNINLSARTNVDTTSGAVSMKSGSNVFDTDETTLFTTLGSDEDITTPAIALGSGGTPYQIAHNAFNNTLHYDSDSDMLGWYGFTGNANDSSPNNNHGTVTGATLTDGNYYVFDGNDSIALTSHSNPRQITLMAWINASSTLAGGNTVLNFGSTMIRLNGLTQIQFWPNVADSNVSKSYTFTHSTWYHLTITYDYDYSPTQGQYKIYVNGSLIANGSGVLNTINPGSLSGKYIGSYGGSSAYYKGSIDEVAIYDRVLTATEIYDQYENLATPYDQSTVTYTTDDGGHSGEAVIIGSGSKLTFPAAGNFNPLQGTIDFWLKKADWTDAADNYIFYTSDGTRTIEIARYAGNSVQMRLSTASGTLYSKFISTSTFVADSWHHFTFSWNINEDHPYIIAKADGFSEDSSIDVSPEDFDPSETFRDFDTETATIYIGTNSSYASPLNGTLDELRITNTEYSSNDYTSLPAIIESEAFDTGVESPLWGDIAWDETLPTGTDIELQTSTSDDGVTWTNWFNSNQQDRGMVTIVFDDGLDTVYDNAYPVMDSYGFPGVMYLITSLIGSNDDAYLNLNEARALEADGWEMGSHTNTHTSLLSSNASLVNGELSTSKQWLIDNGLSYSAIAYPYGNFNQTTISRTSNYFANARTLVASLYQTFNNKYRLSTDNYIAWNDTHSAGLDFVESKKAWQVLTFHGVGEVGTDNISQEDFNDAMAYIDGKDLDVVTMDEAMDRLGMYTDSSGEAVHSQSKRYIRYRAILWSYDGSTAPTLSAVRILEPAKIYKELVTTVDSNAIYTHDTWPETTDTEVALSVTPDSGSIEIVINTWDASAKEWTEEGTGVGSAFHTIGDLTPNQSYDLLVDGAVVTSQTANSEGEITYTYIGGYSTHTFSITPIPAPVVATTKSGSRRSAPAKVVSSNPVPSTTPTIPPTQPVPLEAGLSKPLVLTGPLYFGLTSPNVKLLQQFLNTHGFTIATTGAGAPGHETNYFGQLTKLALAKFQLQNKLISSLQDPVAGYLGPKTRALIGGMK